ncbi:MAG: hypothetical protein KA802_10505 [Saprospiraceae bacterium]|nr:hypothetical protein [Saprospiraceae bacterium]
MAKIFKGIVITSSKFTEPYLETCLDSLKNAPYTVLVVGNDYVPKTDTLLAINDWNAWELGGIAQGKKHFDEFIHIMDSTLIKDMTLFDELFKIDGNVFLTNGGYHYMGKFVSNTLPEIPKISTKQDAIAYELTWLKKPYTNFEPDLPVHTDVFEEKFGQNRMKLENKYIIKWKGTYSL